MKLLKILGFCALPVIAALVTYAFYEGYLCRDARAQKESVKNRKKLHAGMTLWEVIDLIGKPDLMTGKKFAYKAATAAGAGILILFNAAWKVEFISCDLAY